MIARCKLQRVQLAYVYFTENRYPPCVDQSIHLKELLLLEQNKSVTGRELIICFLHLSSAPPPTAPSAIWGSTSVPSLPQWVQFAHRGREPQADHSEHIVRLREKSEVLGNQAHQAQAQAQAHQAHHREHIVRLREKI